MEQIADLFGADIAELEESATWRLTFPDTNDILNFTLTIEPDEGMYKGGRFVFTFNINQNFPHEPPKVKCTQKIYHPNIDLEGNVCLNILREDWKPVLNLNSIIVGVQVRLLDRMQYIAEFNIPQYLFLEPNASDPLNKDAAEELRSNREAFKRYVKTSMAGGTVKGDTFDRVLR
jgi:ubiquitin-conjugating enzyme E2 M